MADTDKTYEILNYYGLKTNIEDTKKWIKQYVADALSKIKTVLMTNVTYNELVSLRDNNKLKPGMLYRMTDYVTKVYDSNHRVSSNENPFDLILVADSTNSLNENARAISHDGDWYFSKCKLNAWEIKYTLDNDDERFDFGVGENVKRIYTDDEMWFRYVGKRINKEDESETLYIWYNEDFDPGVEGLSGYLATTERKPDGSGTITVQAGTLGYIDSNKAVFFNDTYSIVTDAETTDNDGKGIIYYMKDEYDNEAPFDFKNVLQADGKYTFGKSSSREDYTLNGYQTKVYGNKILPQVDTISDMQTINRIRVELEGCHSNLFKPTCVNSDINFTISECDISMNDDGELIIFKTADFISGIKNKPIEHNYKNDYLTFEALEDGEIGWWTHPDSDVEVHIFWSKDKENWTEFTQNDSTANYVSVSNGEKLYCRGINLNGVSGQYALDNDACNGFAQNSGKWNIKGNVMSLIDYNNMTTMTEMVGNFYYLFSDDGFKHGNTIDIVNAIDFVLPATTLASDCYSYMFNGCTSLTTAPALPATTLADWCYYSMFRNCTSLTTAPALPATTLSDNCYNSMFNGCTSLTTAPELPATTLASDCYNSMFNGCTSLTTAPALPATTLADGCYYSMFGNCTSLTTAQELPATTLAEWCYSSMFNGCTSLNYIKCLAINGINKSNSTFRWVANVSVTGTFVKQPNVTESTWGRGNNGIPTNWTLKDAVIE